MSIDSYFCLCCLSSDDLISLQDGNSEKNYEKMLQYLFTFKPMNEENEADSYICDKCVEQLENAYNFKTRVFDTLNILQIQGLIELHKKDGQLIIKKCSSVSSNTFDEKDQKDDDNTQIIEKTEICDEKSSVIDIKVDVKSEDIETIKNKSVVTTVITQPMVKVAMVNAQSYYDAITLSDGENYKEKNIEKESQNQIKLERDKNEETVTSKRAQTTLKGVEKTYEITPDLACQVCGVVQPNLYVYHTHMNSHMQVEICHTCGKGFPNKVKLRRHNYCHRTGPYVCDVCGTEFTNQNTYHAHRQRNHSIISQYACPHCSQRFKSFVLRARHLQSVHGIKHDYACKQCGKTFLVAGSLSTHIRFAHEKVKRFSCSLCDAAFLYRQDLAAHQGTAHNATHNYGCEKCGKRYTLYRQDLAAHQGTAHDATHNYGCEKCGKRFPRKNALTVHMRTHTKEKPYGCALCGKYFTQKCALVVHLKVHNRKGKIRKTLPKKCESKVEVESTVYILRRDNLKTYARN